MKSESVLQYGTAKMLPHHMKSILVREWDAFKVSAGKFIRDIFVKKNLLTLSPTELTMNNQACAASVQVSSGEKAEEINNISRHTVAPIEVQVTRTDYPMVVLQEKGSQKSSRNIVLQAAAYDAVTKKNVTPIQEINIGFTMMLQQKKVILENDVTTWKNPHSSFGNLPHR